MVSRPLFGLWLERKDQLERRTRLDDDGKRSKWVATRMSSEADYVESSQVSNLSSNAEHTTGSLYYSKL